jgi:hypothetical protein
VGPALVVGAALVAGVVVVVGAVVVVVGAVVVVVGAVVVVVGAVVVVVGAVVVIGGPVETTRFTMDPLGTLVPGTGSVLMTSPAVADEGWNVLTPTWSPAWPRMLAASVAVMQWLAQVTSGTWTLVGAGDPVLTPMRMLSPL